jgi:hypothetical protein
LHLKLAPEAQRAAGSQQDRQQPHDRHRRALDGEQLQQGAAFHVNLAARAHESGACKECHSIDKDDPARPCN